MKKVAELIQTNNSFTAELIQEIQSIKSGMNSGRSFSEKELFMNNRKNNIIITEGWLSGFIDGEAYLGVHLSDKPRRRCEPRFSIAQNAHDVAILEVIANFLGVSNKIVDNTGKGSTVKQLTVYNFNILFNKIMVILDNNPLITAKQRDFLKWRTVLFIISEGRHLTLDGFSEISKIVNN